jgi:hypothetical protein
VCVSLVASTIARDLILSGRGSRFAIRIEEGVFMVLKALMILMAKDRYSL